MPKPKKDDEGALVAAAKKVGAVAGKIAAIAGATTPETPPAIKKGKLAKKDRHRLPRRQKKAQKKAQTPPAA